MVEGARLESVYARKGIEGSNPSLSAGKIIKPYLLAVVLSDASYYIIAETIMQF